MLYIFIALIHHKFEQFKNAVKVCYNNDNGERMHYINIESLFGLNHLVWALFQAL